MIFITIDFYDSKFVRRRQSAFEKRGKSAEYNEMLSIGVTSWFRDQKVWETISSIIEEFPFLRAVSIGCATGEEVYSLAFLCEEKSRRYSIVGIDMNGEFIETARKGCYRNYPQKYSHFFSNNCVKCYIKNKIRFVHGDAFYLRIPPSNLVLCRNVFIYMNARGKERLINQIVSSMIVGSYLVVGLSEILFNIPLQRINPFLYKKI